MHLIIHQLLSQTAIIQKKQIMKMGLKKEPITIYPPPNFVELVQSVEILEKFRKKITDPSNKILLYVGRLVEYKGVDYLIKSIKEIKNFKIHLIIVGDGILGNKLKDLTKVLGLEHKVTFFGRANKEELSLLHGISNIFICPSIVDSNGATETLGLVIPEAMKSRLPVIGTCVGGIADIIKHEENGLLVPQKDPTALACAIERILTDKKFATQIIEKSNDTVKEFLPETTARQHFEIFQRLMKTN